jgi:plastocyanin
MSKNAKIVIAIVVLVIIIGGGLILFRPSKTNAPSGNSSTTTSNAETNSTKPAAVTITYDGTSFTNSASSVKSGEAIKVINNSSKQLDFDSDPHPVHTDDPELNAGDIDPGQSKTFTVTKKGHWGFHNHHDPSQHGTITVD